MTPLARPDPLMAALLLGEWVDYTTGYRAGIRRDDLIERTRSFLLDYPAPEGYVLVNADMLAEALESSEPDWFEGNGDDWAMQSAEVAAAAIFAALTRSAQKEGPAR